MKRKFYLSRPSLLSTDGGYLDKIIAEMAFRQSADHRLSYVTVSYAFTSLTNHRLAAVTPQSNYRQGNDHQLSSLPALYRSMNFVTLTWEAELMALVNHRLAAVASQSAFQLTEQQHQQSSVLHQGEVSRRISTTPEVQYQTPSVALLEKQELSIKQDGKYKESPACNQHDSDVEKSLHLLGDVALATTKQVAFSLLDLKTMNGVAGSKMNTNHGSLHYPSPKYSGSALLKWAQASSDLQEREAKGKSIVILKVLFKENVALTPAQAFKRSISRTKNNAKKTKAITKLPLKKRAMPGHELFAEIPLPCRKIRRSAT